MKEIILTLNPIYMFGFPHYSTQMMSTFHNLNIIFLILYALNATICHDVTEDNQGEMDGDFKSLEKRNWRDQEAKRLAISLTKSWQELEKMLFCSKLPICVIRYSKKYRAGQQNVRLNLVQSLTLTLHQIKDISTKLNEIKR